tara:strand:+ start:449 stop:1045 length:597 start_codon:yes stop_codon:yes gene_type:complete
MNKQQKRVQIFLILTGIFLILITYFYYPYMQKTKLSKKVDIEEVPLEDKSQDSEKDTKFKSVEYKGLYDLNKTFTVKSENAHIKADEPDIVYMNNMHVILYLNDGRVVNIHSDKGRYNKLNYNCYFENNVRATDGETKIFAENLDLLGTENTVKIYNDVSIVYPTGNLSADKIDYDFETKYFKVSMFGEDSVKVKVLK